MIGVTHISVAAYRGGGGAAPVNLDFVSTWDTTKAGSASNTVVLPLLSGGTYNGTINWGDGNTSALSYANRTHVYASSGIYTITISGSDIQGFQFNVGDRLKITDISNWGNLTLTTNSCFYGCQNLDISATDAPTISTTSFYRMFRDCVKLQSADLSGWDTTGVTNLEECFNNCYVFTGSISTWDVSDVTTLQNCFLGCYVFNDDISGWNITSDLVNMYGAFSQARAFNQDISGWNVSNVTNMSGMFNDARVFNAPIGSWNVSNVTNMSNMFNGANGFGTNTFNQDISGWDVSSVTNMSSMFRTNQQFNQDISGWDVSNVTNMSYMFGGCKAFNQPIGIWNVSSVTNMSTMFANGYGGIYAFNQDLSSWDIDQVSNFTNFMLTSTGLSTANYDATLVGWESQLQATWPGGVGYPYTININFGGSKYTAGGAADAARASLISNFGWTITDGGSV